MSKPIVLETKFEVDFVLASKYEWQRKSKPTKLKPTLGKMWDTTTEATINFARDLHSHFQLKPQDFGIIIKDPDPTSMPNKLEQHVKVNSQLSFENAFSPFLKQVLSSQLRASNLKDDFIVVCIQFSRVETNNGKPDESSREKYFVVAMLRDKYALMFDSDMRAKSTFIINFSDLLQACRVDLNLFVDRYVNGKASEDNDIAFISKKNNVRDYFHSACGLKSIIKNKDSQNNLKNEIEKFLFETGVTRVERDGIKDKLHDVVTKAAKSKEPITIERIEKELDGALPTRVSQYRGKLIEFLNNEGFQVNSEISVTESLYDDWLWVRVQKGDFQFTARKTDIGRKNSSKPIKIEKSKDGKSIEVNVNYIIKDEESIERLLKAIE